MITKKLTPSEKLLDEIGELFACIGTPLNASEMMRDLLSAGIGGNTNAGKISRSEISSMIANADVITKFVRTLESILPLRSAESEVLMIAELYREIDYEAFSDYIFMGLVDWVHGDDACGHSCLEHVTNVAINFQQVALLIETCWKFKERTDEVLGNIQLKLR